MDMLPPSPSPTWGDPVRRAFGAGRLAALMGEPVEVGCPATADPQIAIAYRNGYAMGLVELDTSATRT